MDSNGLEQAIRNFVAFVELLVGPGEPGPAGGRGGTEGQGARLGNNLGQFVVVMIKRFIEAMSRRSGLPSRCGTIPGTGSGLPLPIAASCTKEPLGHGWLRVEFDGGAPVTLSPRLAKLFGILEDDSHGRSNDGLLVWRPVNELADRLGEKGLDQRRWHAVNNLVHRLRDTFEASGYDRRLIQSSRRHGVRLRLERGISPETRELPNRLQ